MKKHLFLAAVAAVLTAPAFAQTSKMTTKNEATGAKTTTEVKVRDNGTMKVETTERTGRTATGEVIHEAAQDTKMAGKKVAHGTKEVGKDVAHGTEKVVTKVAHGTKEVAKDVAHGTKKAAQKVDNAAEKSAENVKEAAK